MIGIDTNVLLRLFLRDDPKQTERAERLVREAGVASPILVNTIVLSEFAWTLARNKRLKRMGVADFLERVLDADDIAVLHADAARRALTIYRKGRADYPDYLIACINTENGCAKTMTFDADATDFDEFSSVP